MARINFFKVYHFYYILKLFYSLQNCVIHLKKKMFFCQQNVMKKVILSCLKVKLVCMYMLGRLLCQIRAGGRGERGGSLHEGGENCLKYLRKEWNRNEGVQDFKIGGKLH